MHTITGEWAGRLQHTEFFFHQFIAYIFQTDEGRRIRGKFLREILFRTLTYIVGAAPILVALWFFHLLGDSTVANSAIGLLIGDIAFGAAFIRTVYLYRHRVRAVYQIYFGHEAANPNDLPPDEVLDAVFDQLSDASSAPSAGRRRKSAAGNVATVEKLERAFTCKRCHCLVTFPVKQKNLPKQCPCGGALVES